MPSNAEVIHSIIDKMSLSTSADMFAEHLADDFKAVTYPLVIGWPEKDKNGWIEHMSMGSAMYLERKVCFGFFASCWLTMLLIALYFR
jgi:hypothetical protein